jgi:sulfur carrier protein
MTVVLNGQRCELRDNTTLTDAVAQLTGAMQGVAVAVNGAVVPRGLWPTTVLAEADEIEVLTAVQGG